MNQKKKKFRLAIIRSHPTQYFAPLYRALAQSEEIEIHVYYINTQSGKGAIDPEFGVPVKWDLDLRSGYPNTTLNNWKLGTLLPHPFNFFSFELLSKLKQGHFDAIFNAGFGNLLDWEAIFLARLLKISLILRPEINDVPNSPTNLKSLCRQFFLRSLYKNIGAFLAIGQRAKIHFLTHGGNPKQVFFSPYCVDNDFFTQQCQTLPEKSDLKKNLGLDPKKKTILFCGKFISKKRPLLLIQALVFIKNTANFSLLFVGDGPLKEEMISELERLKFSDYKMVGFVNQSEIAKMYKASDVLVLPSDRGETWGLVVNEALACGLPILVSSEVGCSDDLVLPGKTGYIFESGNAKSLAEAITNMVAMSDKNWTDFHHASAIHIKKYSIEMAVEGFAKALVCAQDRGKGESTE